VCIDIFTKKAALAPMSTKKAEDSRRAFVEVVKQLGLPACIMVDGESEFQGEFAATVKKFFDVDIMISRHSACSWSA
jgi:hypothetical protein